METTMEYRYTDSSKAAITLDVTVGDVADLRAALEAILAGDVSNVSRWQTRAMVRKLADAQRQAADMLRVEADALAERAKLGDEF
jgi:hypothetical protein